MDIQLKNIGKLSEITLQEISKINYIVGENGSGKSALLAALLKLGEKENQNFLNTYKSKYGFLSYLNENSHVRAIPDDISVEVRFIDSISVLSPFFKNDIPNIRTGKNFSIESLGITQLRLQDGDKSMAVEKFYYEENRSVRLSKSDAINARASGIKTFSYLEQNIVDHLKKRSKGIPRLFFIIIDEPEIHIHPKWHKKIHKFFEKIIHENNNLFFFVATHSSYLIASAAESQADTKVYCLSEGELITSTAYWTDLAENNDRHIGNQTKGFRPSECKLLAHDILGSTLENYFPKIIYCENSLKDFIETFIDNNADIYDRPLIIHSRSDIEIAEKIKPISLIIEGLRKHQKLNLHLLGPTAYGIVDAPNPKQKSEEQIVKEINEEFPGSIIVLSETEIEKSYPEKLLDKYLNEKRWKAWDRSNQSFNTYLKVNGITDHKSIGMEKSSIAKYVGEKISKDDFANRFKKIHELLIKE